jgi:hypothetical protein
MPKVRVAGFGGSWRMDETYIKVRVPTKITLDAYASSHRVVREMKEDGGLPCRVNVRSSQCAGWRRTLSPSSDHSSCRAKRPC